MSKVFKCSSDQCDDQCVIKMSSDSDAPICCIYEDNYIVWKEIDDDIEDMKIFYKLKESYNGHFFHGRYGSTNKLKTYSVLKKNKHYVILKETFVEKDILKETDDYVAIIYNKTLFVSTDELTEFFESFTI